MVLRPLSLALPVLQSGMIARYVRRVALRWPVDQRLDGQRARPGADRIDAGGRVGSGIAAELDRWSSPVRGGPRPGTDPIRKLVVPRVLAGFIMCPILTVVSDTVGLLGGWIVAFTQLRVSSGVYWHAVVEGLFIQDVYMGIIKPFFLGIVIVTIGCHVGLRTSGGTQGVGRSTTNAVVAASVAVLIVDFFVTRLLLSILF